jgi:hypothetical protein
MSEVYLLEIIRFTAFDGEAGKFLIVRAKTAQAISVK